MNSKAIGLIFSIIFAGGVVFGFFWMWTQLKADPATSKNTAFQSAGVSDLSQVDISTTKKDAENILTGKEKFSDIPISVKPDKMGRANPFSALK